MREKQKTLVILSPGFPKNEADSTCIPPQQVFVKNLKQNFPDLNIIVLAFQYPYRASEYLWHGVNVIAFGGKNRRGITRLRTWMRIWFKLVKLKKRHQVIGILSFWLGECAYMGSAFAKRNKLEHFCWILGQDAKLGNKYVKRANLNEASMVALSDFISKEFYRNYGVKPMHVIPVGIDTTMFGPPQTERDIDILGAGSLIPLKQFHLLVNIIQRLKHYKKDIQTVICGAGPEFETLQGMIIELQLENNVKLAAELPHHEVLALMQQSKVLLHTSAYEGFGVVCLEALYAGAQVVSFVKPMDEPIENWHIAKDYDDMLRMTKVILEDAGTNHSRVAPYLVEDANKAFMKLFDHNERAIS